MLCLNSHALLNALDLLCKVIESVDHSRDSKAPCTLPLEIIAASSMTNFRVRMIVSIYSLFLTFNIALSCTFFVDAFSYAPTVLVQDMFYEKADALVGICRDHATNSSRTLTLDLEAVGDA